MNTVCHKQLHFGSFFGEEFTANFEGGRITSDGGALLLRELDERHGLTEAVAVGLDDPIHGHQLLSFFTVVMTSTCTIRFWSLTG